MGGKQKLSSFLDSGEGCIGPHQEKPLPPPRFQNCPRTANTAVWASLATVSGCRGELSPCSSPEDRTLLAQHPLHQAQSGPLRAGGLATPSPADGASDG